MSENTYCIRKCEHKDMEALIEIRLEFLKEAGLANEGEDVSDLKNELHRFIELHLNKDLYMWVAEIDNKIAATGAVSIWDKLPTHFGNENSSKVGYISNMYTRPEYRKKGIASLIVKGITDFLCGEGIPKVMLHAFEDGKGVYKKSGFVSNESFMEMKID